MTAPSQECLIALTKGQFAKVDPSDFERIAQSKWYARLDHHTGKFYAERYQCLGNKKRRIRLMHRDVMELNDPADKQLVDHINGDTLDNRRCNLRLCTNRQNQGNRGTQKNNVSGFKGVYFDLKEKRWIAQLRINGYRTKKRFRTKEEAAKMYDELALSYFGEFAKLNFPKEAGSTR